MDPNSIPAMIEILQSLEVGGGTGPPLPPADRHGTIGGMDPWQTSVENRLGSLDARLGKIEADVGNVRTDVASIKSDVAHLPGKGFIVSATVSALALVAAVSAFVQWVLSASVHHP